MSAAMRAKNANERANILLDYFRRAPFKHGFPRGMSACLEMDDGDEVVRIIIKRASKNENTRRAVINSGHGFWLEPGYLDSDNTAPKE